ncbi:N-methyl-L-tryptophan oxidase [Rhodococcus opacus]|uniref:N-methyl-L-tryptophan oxidase n=1 Tax=Rhodococcus opacus TaxID=37919 RepID=A0A2S8IWL9_RHOOP|nr:N-methyl-L-tryptophan oxidase [Rhodococcus opacus]PQP19204.1 N-methyl-L-tryptophan oxidase [Rhodococcus opacus]
MTTTRTGVAVIGTGTMGSAIMWRLSERGVPAVGLEQFTPGHDRGSGHGESRIFRTAYHEDPAYVPMLRAALRGWRELGEQTGEPVLTMTGSLSIGPSTGVIVSGSLEAARVHDLTQEILDPSEFSTRFPTQRLRGGDTAIWENDAGVIRPELAITGAARRASELGASVRPESRVIGIEDGPGDTVLVRLDDEVIRADHVVVAAGAWIPSLLPAAHLPLTVERKILAWFPAEDPTQFGPDRFPVFLRDSPEGTWYGFPTMDGKTVKIALHLGGRETDPDELDRVIHDEDTAPLRDLVRRYLPGLGSRPVRAAVCMYTNTPDGHFVIGNPLAYRNVTVISACSGHGFKFAPVIGEIAADLSCGSTPEFPLELFDVNRFAD